MEVGSKMKFMRPRKDPTEKPPFLLIQSVYPYPVISYYCLLY